MKTVVGRTIMVILALALLSYVGFQVVNGFDNPYTTESAVYRSYDKYIDLNGYIVKDEVLLSSSNGKVVKYNYKNGDKVGAGSTIANVYDSEESLEDATKTLLLKSKIEVLEKSLKAESTASIKPDMLNAQISDDMMAIIENVDNGTLDDIDTVANDMLYNMNKLSIYLNDDTDYSETLNRLKNSLAEYSVVDGVIDSEISSEDGGYFTKYTDGYENIFTIDSINGLTVTDIRDNLKRTSEEADAIGKLQIGSRWYFVSEIPVEYVNVLKEKKNVQLKFGTSAQQIINSSIYKVINEGDKAAVILCCGNIDDNILSMRFEKPRLIIDTYEGIVIPKEALRVSVESDEDTGGDVQTYGVNVLIHDMVQFKKIDIIYQDDDYIVVKKPQSGSYLSAGDEIITKGYD